MKIRDSLLLHCLAAQLHHQLKCYETTWTTWTMAVFVHACVYSQPSSHWLEDFRNGRVVKAQQRHPILSIRLVELIGTLTGGFMMLNQAGVNDL